MKKINRTVVQSGEMSISSSFLSLTSYFASFLIQVKSIKINKDNPKQTPPKTPPKQNLPFRILEL